MEGFMDLAITQACFALKQMFNSDPEPRDRCRRGTPDAFQQDEYHRLDRMRHAIQQSRQAHGLHAQLTGSSILWLYPLHLPFAVVQFTCSQPLYR